MLLQTKLYIPATRSTLVPRPRLLAKLNAGLPGRLTLVAAPAGFGKTTLIADWGRQLAEAGERAFAWVSLDEGDNEPVTFYNYLIAALQTVDARLGLFASELLQSPQLDHIQGIVTALLNDIAGAGRATVLVLDDYHSLTNPAIHEGVRFLLENAPPAFHLVLLGRADPPFSLGRLRARHQMTEIRQADLRFTLEEALHFLRELMALDLPESAVSTLAQRTEGWVAGLQMAGLALQGSRPAQPTLPEPGTLAHESQTEVEQFIADFSGSHRYIFDYLAEEALTHRPAGTRAFLLQSAILERLCAPLCDAVLQRDGSRRVLQQLESANLFLVPLDDVRYWYRYHHLFADLLRHHLRREQPALIPVLHLRASRWFEEAGYAEEAMQHALAAEAFERAAALLSDYSGSLVTRGEINRLLEWIDRLPPHWQRQHPQLVLNHAWAKFFRDSAEAVEATLAHIPETVADRPPYAAYILLLRGTMAARERDTTRALALAEEAEEALATLPATEGNLIMRGVNALNLANATHWHRDGERAHTLYETAIARNRETQNLLALMNAIRGRGELLFDQARLAEAEIALREGISAERAWAGRSGEPERKLLAAAPLHVSLGKLYYEWNRLDEAEDHLADAVAFLASSGPINRGEGLAALVRLRLARGEVEAVPPLLQALVELRVRMKGRYARRRVSISLAETRAALYGSEPSTELRAALRQSLAELDGEPGTALAQARLLLALDRPAEALPLLKQELAQVEATRWPGLWLPLAAALCLATYRSGKKTAALSHMVQMLPVAGPSGYVRLWLDGGRPVHDLLEMAVQREGRSGYAMELLARFPAPPPPGPTGQAQTDEPPGGNLSPREMEVLQLVAQGLTNKQIANRLVIATSTAKRHTINIYNKLGVNNRTQAVTRAQELGIL